LNQNQLICILTDSDYPFRVFKRLQAFRRYDIIRFFIYLRKLRDNDVFFNTTGVTSGAGTAYPSGTPEVTPVLSGVRTTRSLVL
jgi:hypothetical protein